MKPVKRVLSFLGGAREPCPSCVPPLGWYLRLTQEKEALFTPVALTLVTVAAVGLTRFAFGSLSVGLLRTGLVAVLFKPRA